MDLPQREPLVPPGIWDNGGNMQHYTSNLGGKDAGKGSLGSEVP